MSRLRTKGAQAAQDLKIRSDARSFLKGSGLRFREFRVRVVGLRVLGTLNPLPISHVKPG